MKDIIVFKYDNPNVVDPQEDCGEHGGQFRVVLANIRERELVCIFTRPVDVMGLLEAEAEQQVHVKALFNECQMMQDISASHGANNQNNNQNKQPNVDVL